MKIKDCPIILTTQCSKCKKPEVCGAFVDKNGRFVKKGEYVYFCQKCINKLEKETK